jgi:hypothetical protein
MKCNIKQHKPLTPYQIRKHDAEISFRNFQYVLGLTAIALETMGADKLQTQSVINKILEQYECLSSGTVSMDDIHNYLEEYGIQLLDNHLSTKLTKYDEEIDELKAGED